MGCPERTLFKTSPKWGTTGAKYRVPRPTFSILGLTLVFGGIQTCCVGGHRNSLISTCHSSCASQDPSGSVGICRNPSGSVGIRRDPSGSVGMRRDPSGSVGIRRDPSGSVGVRRDPSGSVGIRRDPSGSVGVCWEPFGSVGIRRAELFVLMAKHSKACSKVEQAPECLGLV